MHYVLLTLIVAAMVTYWLSYHKAKRLVPLSGAHIAGDDVWHARPAHFGLYGFGKAALVSVSLLVAWWIFRAPLIETLLSYVLTSPSKDDAAFFMYEIRQAMAMRTGGTLTNLQTTWVEHYRSYLGIGNYAVTGLALLLAVAGGVLAYRNIKPSTMARHITESWIRKSLIGAASLSVAITILIFLSVVFEAILFFSQIPVHEFIFGTAWSPQTAIRADQAGASGTFGFIPLFVGTLLITFIALCVAVPIGLFAAIYMSEYATKRVRTIGKPVLEILAGIPTVVYGFFAVITMAPFLRGVGESIGLDVASESALAAGLVMGIMIIPLVSSLADDAIASVPRALRDASYGLGATQSETIKQVVLPAALPGIMGGILLATSRAIGETMIVVMAAGLSANLTINPLESVTTITVQIVALLVGDQEFGSTKTLAAFALGLTLFLFTLLLNILALHMVRRYREAYE